MTSFAIKRVMKDILKYEKNKEMFNKEGIYINFNTDHDNILGTENKPHYAILIGPRGGPLQGGFFPFKFWFKPNYPETPPKVEFYSLSSQCRIHPNLYANGKVCLSLLGTWNGPSWTMVMNITSVFTSILGLVLGLNHPIQGEPSYEFEKGELSRQYNNVVCHETSRLYICKMIIETPEPFIGFLPDIIEYFKENYNDYIKFINEYRINIKNNTISYPIYYKGLIVKNVYNEILENLELKAIEYNFSNININKNENTIKMKTILKRKAPNVAASKLGIGTILKSENDGKNWIVKEYRRNNKPFKKWVRINIK